MYDGNRTLPLYDIFQRFRCKRLGQPIATWYLMNLNILCRIELLIRKTLLKKLVACNEEAFLSPYLEIAIKRYEEKSAT